MTRTRTLATLAILAALSAGCTTTSDGGSDATDTSTSAAKPKPTKKAPEMTAAQENALESAQAYVDMSGFSKAGLIQQLTSKAGDGYKRADAVYAVNHVKADWNKEAVEAAKAYLEMSSFSRSGLIEQLSSKSGDQFTQKQAEYAADKVGL